MKFCLPLIFVLFVGSSYAQETDSIINYNSLLRTGDLFSFDNKSIQFKKVISDSRCPKDVTCIWAGEAKVLIAVMENGKQLKEEIVTLSAAKNFKFSFSNSKGLYNLNSLDLFPYPLSTHKIEDSEYCLEIKFSKRKENPN